MVELVYTSDLKSDDESHEGSTPSIPTKNALYWRRRYRRRKEAGQCVRCNNPTTASKCRRCAIKQSERDRARYLRKVQSGWRKNGRKNHQNAKG